MTIGLETDIVRFHIVMFRYGYPHRHLIRYEFLSFPYALMTSSLWHYAVRGYERMHAHRRQTTSGRVDLDVRVVILGIFRVVLGQRADLFVVPLQMTQPRLLERIKRRAT